MIYLVDGISSVMPDIGSPEFYTSIDTFNSSVQKSEFLKVSQVDFIGEALIFDVPSISQSYAEDFDPEFFTSIEIFNSSVQKSGAFKTSQGDFFGEALIFDVPSISQSRANGFYPEFFTSLDTFSANFANFCSLSSPDSTNAQSVGIMIPPNIIVN